VNSRSLKKPAIDLAVGLLLAHAGVALGAGKTELKFQFDQNGTPSMHTFVLKWDGPDQNLKTIDVLVSDTKEKIQTIEVPQDKVKIIYKDVTEPKPQVIKDMFTDSLDYNFDKYSDLRLMQQFPYRVGDKKYVVWLFDDEANAYVLNEAISALPAPVPEPKKKRIWSTTLGGYAGHEYVSNAYAVKADGTLKVYGRITQKVEDGKGLTFVKDVRMRRYGGPLERICKIRIPTEGKAKKLWGSRERCEQYMTKEPPAK
jgi:hypothetical protein